MDKTIQATNVGTNWLHDLFNLTSRGHCVTVTKVNGGTCTVYAGSGLRCNYRLNGQRISYKNLWSYLTNNCRELPNA